MNKLISAFSLLTIFSFVSPANSAVSSNGETIVVATEAVAVSGKEAFEDFLDNLYDEADLKKAGMDFDVFKRAATGFYNLKEKNKLSRTKDLLTVVDFNKPSSEKRLWIVDLNKKKVLYHSLVAHGMGSGNEKAVKFSNVENSHMSSLGFYVTENTYIGKHGLSLKLNGLDRGFNSNAKQRAVVVHGADYVSEAFVKQHGRLGRSHGCPALPKEITTEVVQLIKGGTCLYIDGPSSNYTSAYLDADSAIKRFETEILAKQAKLLSK
ncbi:murein L,D-transpeptidase catalytic domain family protein [Rufibacter sediminis]|uniref:Murein L,D-transpeptidase catalytic domain family protein n=1 Tax=Rufibacter sediminis TaxID=2762756 RepID=A0ABR6VRF9_9BACT|nr:murein L,D-transpeptidase catalytic domain family protein [Rufibacter sediminis]MBC3539792.1 murein L,D-transpeptidase catalytic domain family protein [Rufibacter sediminis]